MKINKKLGSFFKFLIFEILFCILTLPIIIFYGPFNNVKQTVVGSSVTTLRHQYIAKLFLSEEDIQRILSENKFNIDKQRDLDIISKNVKNNKNDKIKIENLLIESKRFKGYALLINNASKVKVGYSNKLKVEGEHSSNMAQRYKALAAVNGGGFLYDKLNGSWFSTGATPTGFLISGGEIIYNNKNADAMLDTMAFTKDGVLLVGKHSLNQLKNMKVRDAISFGPPLVINGKGTITSGDGGWGIAPRTAIGQRKDGTIVLLVIDGRQSRSYGATLKDVEQIMIKCGAYNATNLDGGASSAMYFKGKIINNPSDPLGERTVPSIVYVEN